MMQGYYKTLKQLQSKAFNKAFLPIQKFKGLMFAPNKYMRTDNLPVDETISDLEKRIKNISNKKEKQNLSNLIERIESVSDLTENLYGRLNQNPNTFSYWFPCLLQAHKQAYIKGNHFFKIPSTKCITLPLELSQFMRIEYPKTNQISRDNFNKILLDKLKLDPNKHYFLKTGVFSGKFEWRNVHLIPSEQSQIGEYFQVINNHAMLVGAGRSNDIVVREYINDPEGRPTIYDGMPLRTEFRCFIDCDTKDLIQTVAYWNPLVMKNVLKSQGLVDDRINEWYLTYKSFEERLMIDFNDNIGLVNKHIQPIIDCLQLKGRWSLDIMKSGNDYYLIDMAQMEKSALQELIDPAKIKQFNIKLNN